MNSAGNFVDINAIIDNFKKKECLRERQNRDSIEILSQTRILQKHNQRLSKKILDQKQVLLNLNIQSASKIQELKFKKVATKDARNAQECCFNKESKRIDEMCKSYEEEWELTRIGIASIYDEMHKLKLKSGGRLQNNIFQVDAFEFVEMQIKADASQESNYSALSIEDWTEQEPIDGHSSQFEQLNETNGYSTEETTQDWQLPKIQGANDTGKKGFGFPNTDSFACRKLSTASKKQDQFSSSKEQPQGGVISMQQKGAEGYKLTSSGRSFKQKAVTSAVVSSSPFDVGVSATAFRVGKMQSTAAMVQRRSEPAVELAQNSNTDDDNPYWDYDIGDCFEDGEDDWPDISSLPHKQADDDESYSKRQHYVFQPRRSLMK